MNSIFLPVCGQVFLTFGVWIFLFASRRRILKRDRIPMQALAEEDRFQVILKEVVHVSDNFENLFEMPVLFYVAAVVIEVSGFSDGAYLKLAWAFVIFRGVHSFIHCTYNRVRHRFYAYAVSSLLLWGMWIRIAAQVLSESQALG